MKKLTCAALLLAAATSSQAAPLPDNAELIAMQRADQADRTGDIDWTVLNQRDKERRERAAALLAAGAVRSARDYYNAAMVFQHGDTPDDYALAFSLATIARQLAPEHPAPKWLHAAAFDRYLVSRNMPQWYGTQSKTYSDGRTELDPVDPKAVSEEQRVALGVPRLQDELARVAKQNKNLQAK